MNDFEPDDDWLCEDDTGSLPGCLGTRRIERTGDEGGTRGEGQPE